MSQSQSHKLRFWLFWGGDEIMLGSNLHVCMRSFDLLEGTQKMGTSLGCSRAPSDPPEYSPWMVSMKLLSSSFPLIWFHWLPCPWNKKQCIFLGVPCELPIFCHSRLFLVPCCRKQRVSALTSTDGIHCVQPELLFDIVSTQVVVLCPASA